MQKNIQDKTHKARAHKHTLSSTPFYFLHHCCHFQLVKRLSCQLLGRLNVFQYARAAVKLHGSPPAYLKQIVSPFGKYLTPNDIFLYSLCVTAPIIEEAIFLGTLKWCQMLDRLIVFKARLRVFVLHTESSRKQPPNRLRSVAHVGVRFHVWGSECARVCKHDGIYIFLEHPSIFFGCKSSCNKAFWRHCY